MKQKRVDITLLAIGLAGFLLMSVSFLLMPIEMLCILPGVLFWLGMLIGIVMFLILENRRRAFFKAYGIPRQKMQKPRCGLLNLCSNPLAKLTDGLLLVSLVAMVITWIVTGGFAYLCYLLVSTTVFLFCLHCIFNGRIYFHVNNQLKIRQALEKRSVRKEGEGEK